MLMDVMEEVFKLVRAERAAQDEKWGTESNPMAVGGSHKKMTILVEEVGEVAKALLDGGPEDVRKELVQVAATAVYWLELIHPVFPKGNGGS